MRAAAFWLVMVAAAVAVSSAVTDSHPLRLAAIGLVGVAGVVWVYVESRPEPLAPYSQYQGLDR